jgi:hypothetical protein
VLLEVLLVLGLIELQISIAWSMYNRIRVAGRNSSTGPRTSEATADSSAGVTNPMDVATMPLTSSDRRVPSFHSAPLEWGFSDVILVGCHFVVCNHEPKPNTGTDCAKEKSEVDRAKNLIFSLFSLV